MKIDAGLFPQGGEVGAILRSLDWSQTPLGTVLAWPSSLHTTLSILLNSGCPMVLIWGRDRVLFYNDDYATLTHLSPAAARIGQPVQKNWAEGWNQIRPEVEQVFATGQSLRQESAAAPSDRPAYPQGYTWSYSAIRDGTGQVAGVLATGCRTLPAPEPVNSPRLSSSELKPEGWEAAAPQPEQTGHSLAGNTPDLIIRYNRALCCLYISPHIEQVVGLPPERFLGQTGVALGLTDAAAQTWYTLLSSTFETGQSAAFEYDSVNAAGERRSYQAHFVPELRRKEQVTTALVVVRDFTEYKRVERSLRQSEERLKLAMAGAQMGTWDVDLTTGNAIWSDQHFTMLGYEPTATGVATEAMWQNRIHPDDLEQVGQEWQHARQDKRLYRAEYRVIRADTGEIAWLAGLGSFTYNAAGEATRSIGVLFDISERKQAEAEREHLLQTLAAERAQFEAVLRQMPAGVVIAQAPSGQLVLGNQQAEQIWRHPFLSSSNIEEYREYRGFHLDGSPYEPQEWPLARSLATGETVPQEEIRFLRGDGTWGVMEASSTPVYDQAGRITAGVVIFQDISYRKQAEDLLRQREQRLDLAVRAAKLGVFEWDVQADRAVWENSRMYELFGHQPEEGTLSKAQFMEVIHSEDRASFEERLAASVESGSLLHTIFRIQRRDNGQWRWLECSGQFELAPDGTPLYLVGVLGDITDRYQAEAALRESEERLRLALKAANQGLYDLNVQTGDAIVTPEYAEMLDYDPHEFQETNAKWRDRLHPDDAAEVYQAYQDYTAGHCDEYRVEFRQRTQSGDWKWILSIGKIVSYDSEGNPLRMLGTHTDITDRKQVEAALRESESRFRNIADHSPIVIWISAPDGASIWFNQQWSEFTGQTLEEAVGDGWLAALHPEDADSIATTCLQAHQQRQPVRLEYRLRRQDGDYRWVFDSAVPRFDGGGTYLGYIGSIIDITDRKLAEADREQLLERELAARETAERANRIKDEFLAVLSHELRSPLNPILGWVKLLQSRTLSAAKTQQALATIERNAKLQTQLIEDLLDVSRILRGKLVLRPVPVNLVSTVESALETVRLAAEAKDIRLLRSLAELGPVMGDSARLQQVIWNLLSNAVKFTPSGGTVHIELAQSGPYAQIRVQDTGKGISPTFLPHVFEYFRQEDGTTTRNFGGLGLGLAIVHHLVELHGGTAWAESAGEGLGAIFTVRLPLLSVPPTPLKEPSQLAPQAHLRGVQILVVDDEPDIREIVAFILEQAGAIVSVAASAPEALGLLDKRLPDLLLCDIGMPTVDGYMLIRQIRTRPPEQGGQIPAIALTAYAGEIDQRQALAAGFQRHLAKPIEPDAMVHAIAALLVEIAASTQSPK